MIVNIEMLVTITIITETNTKLLVGGELIIKM